MWKLRASMMLTLAIIIGITTLAITIVLNLIGITDLTLIITTVLLFNVVQWLFAPYIVDFVYGVREAKPGELPEIEAMLERLSIEAGIKKPKLMISEMKIPNAFAYGSPIAGTRVAVTRGLLETLDLSEIEAVLGHELGHIKHKDVQIMMMVSVLPAIFYWLGRSLMFTGDREERSGAVVGLFCIGIYWILTLFTLYLSRLREYYADAFSAKIVPFGAKRLSLALAKIVSATSSLHLTSGRKLVDSSFKTLFITDPDRAVRDAVELKALSGDYALVERIKSRNVSLLESVLELFSTHPNIVKRLRALERLEYA